MTTQQYNQIHKVSQFDLPLTFVQPLWKRVYSKNKDNEEQHQSPLFIEHEASSRKSETGFSRFLTKTHDRISESYCGTESEIMQKMQIDWQDENENELNFNQQKSYDTSKLKCKRKSLAIQAQVFSQLKQLKKCKNLQQFIDMLSIINTDIHKQIMSIKQENQKIKNINKSLLYKQSKMNVQIKLLQNQLIILQNKYQQITNDFQKHIKQNHIQIQTNQHKYQINLQQKIQQITKDYESKLQKMSSDFQTSTKYSTMTENGKKEQIILNQHEECDYQEKTKPFVFKQSLKALNMSAQFKKQKQNNGKNTVQRQKSKAKRFENDLENIICRIIKPSSKSLGICQQTSQPQ